MECVLEMPDSRNVTLWAAGHPGGDTYGGGVDGAQDVSSLVLPISKRNEPKCFAQTKYSVRLRGVALCPAPDRRLQPGGIGLFAQVKSFYDSRIKEASFLPSIALQWDHARQNQISVKGKRT